MTVVPPLVWKHGLQRFVEYIPRLSDRRAGAALQQRADRRVAVAVRGLRAARGGGDGLRHRRHRDDGRRLPGVHRGRPHRHPRRRPATPTRSRPRSARCSPIRSAASAWAPPRASTSARTSRGSARRRSRSTCTARCFRSNRVVPHPSSRRSRSSDCAAACDEADGFTVNIPLTRVHAPITSLPDADSMTIQTSLNRPSEANAEACGPDGAAFVRGTPAARRSRTSA